MREAAVFFCDLTGVMGEPWRESGYDIVLVDPQHGETTTEQHVNGTTTHRIAGTILDALPFIGQMRKTHHIAFAFGFPPCTDVAVSGAKHFEAKRQKDPHFQAKAAIVAEQCRTAFMLLGCPWGFENPISVFSSIFGKAQHSFHPWHFTGLCESDNYTKNTQLWTSDDFRMPEPVVHPKVAEAVAMVKAACGRMVPKPKAREATGDDPLVIDWYPDDRIHKAPPGDERANFRSATPSGFSMAAYHANSPRKEIQLKLAIA